MLTARRVGPGAGHPCPPSAHSDGDTRNYNLDNPLCLSLVVRRIKLLNLALGNGFPPPAYQLRRRYPISSRHRQEVNVWGQLFVHDPRLGLVLSGCSATPPAVFHPARHHLQQLENSVTGHMRTHKNLHCHQIYGATSRYVRRCHLGAYWSVLVARYESKGNLANRKPLRNRNYQPPRL